MNDADKKAFDAWWKRKAGACNVAGFKKMTLEAWQAACEWRDSQATQINQQFVRALERIAAIEDQLQGGDWDEIEEAREIAKTALAATQMRGDA